MFCFCCAACIAFFSLNTNTQKKPSKNNHQKNKNSKKGLEALALSTVLAATAFPRAKKVAMIFLYSVTTPLGIAIGIAVSSFYDAGSATAVGVQGVLNGVSGGMLLYISMYQVRAVCVCVLCVLVFGFVCVCVLVLVVLLCAVLIYAPLKSWNFPVLKHPPHTRNTYHTTPQLIGEEFSRNDLLGRPGLLAAMYGALLVGAAAMAVIAIWA